MSAHQQRRFRNRDERKAILHEIEEKADASGIVLPDSFLGVLEQFVESSDVRGAGPKGAGYTFSGSVPLSDVAKIEYCFPGRRVLPQFAKIARIERDEDDKPDTEDPKKLTPAL